MTDSVRVTAADYNGSTWDGNPFEPMAAWIGTAVREAKIRVRGSNTDYAVFDVVTPAGVAQAMPGDRIERAVNGDLRVVRAHG